MGRMDAHFRAFSFVDRLTCVEPGRRVRGRYAIPAGLGHFPLSLVGEAVGQLAAWAAMAAADFKHRPVAGLAGRIELLQDTAPGQVVELAADVESVDAESVQYSGEAHANGTPVIRLTDCVGPMMPVTDFDDPEALRARFRALQGQPAANGSFPGLPELAFQRTGGERGQRVTASFRVPSQAPFFADHFPRRPVFPGSLLMHINLQLGAALAAELPPPAHRRWLPATIQDMKLRSFIAPGTSLLLEARLKQHAQDSVCLALETRAGNELIATARLLLRAGGER